MKTADLTAAIRAAKQGDQIVYGSGLIWAGENNPSRRAAWDAMQAGLVLLARRRAERGFDYLAIRTGKPWQNVGKK